MPFAEDLNYWKTSKVSPDAWIDRAEGLIEKYGGEVLSRAFRRQADAEAHLLEFRFGGQRFKVVWPTLPSKYQFDSRNPEKPFRAAARRQAATMLYHDIKARGVRHAIAGPRAAFFEFLVLPDGRCAGELANPDLMAAVPKLLTA